MLLTSARRYFLSGWFWGGVGVALLIFLPNFLWQVQHGFISVHFLQHIHVRDVRQGRANGFLKDQLILGANMAAVPCGLRVWWRFSATSATDAGMDVCDPVRAVLFW